MLVLLDNADRRLVFRRPDRLIFAHAAREVPGALTAVARALAEGRHVAGWLGYELGYALEPRFLKAPSALRSAGAATGTSPASASRAGEVGIPLLRLGVFDAPQTAVAEPAGRAYAGPLAPEWDEGAYGRPFTRLKDYIAAGDLYQANLSFRARFAFAGDPLALYRQLRRESGAAHCAYVDDGDRHILSLSPELFFDLAADGTLTARPMKGTAPREGDDAAERARLAASEKDRAENLMIVDLIRNDLARIAQTGSVAVRDLFEVETYPTLHTMVSTVTARKRPEAGVTDILAALFPCGSVTGAPKIRAMEILRELETSPRGAYCGAIGHFAPAPDGNISARFNVAIRTLTITGNRGELGIGGGVVQDSRSESEYAECRLKARFFEAARRPLELIETLKYENGFVRLEGHLARMKNSADVFGLYFDETAARAALDASVILPLRPSLARGPATTTSPVSPPGAGEESLRALRVRLTLDEAGEFHTATAPLTPNPRYWSYAVSPAWVQSGDLFQQHKTNWREMYEREVARLGTDEVVFLNERGEVAEGARSNVFVMGPDGIFLTPPLTAGALPGCLRAALIASGEAREATLMPDDLTDNVLFGNSLRGLIPARRA